MNIRSLSIKIAALAAVVLVTGCKIKYSFTGTSIPPQATTVSIAYFPNNAAMVAPILSPTFTDALQDKFRRQTRLQLVNEGGDLNLEGEITGYTSEPASVSGATETATRNRLKITVRVRYTSSYTPNDNFDRTFSSYLDYDVTQMLQDVEASLIPQIVDMLVEDIFNAAVASNW